jgi:hypothetical protein
MTQQFLRNKTALLIALALTTGLLVGCGESSVQSLTPVGPSDISGAGQLEGGMQFSTADSSGGVILTNGHEDDEDSDVDSDADSDADSEDNQGGEAEIEGVIHSVASCQSFTVQVGITNMPVQTNALTTSFRNGGCADVAVGRRVEVKGRRSTLDGPIAATRVEFEEAGHEAEIEGVIHSVASCQSFTVQVGITNMPVQTNALTTSFRNGGCADVTVGTWVEVKGRRLILNGPIEATRIEFENRGTAIDDEDSDADSDWDD